MGVVALEPRQQARSQKRGLAGARRAQNDQQSWRRRFSQAAHPVARDDDRRLAPKKNSGVGFFQRAQSAIRRATGLVGGRPGEELGIEARLVEPILEAAQPLLRKRYVFLFVRARERDAKDARVLPSAQICSLPCAGIFGGQGAEPQSRFDQNREQLLVEPARERVFLGAPAGRQPMARHQKYDRFAALRRLVQRSLPTLARRDPAIRIEVEKRVAPAAFGQPLRKRQRLEIVATGMADENLRQGQAPRAPVYSEQIEFVTGSNSGATRRMAALSMRSSLELSRELRRRRRASQHLTEAVLSNISTSQRWRNFAVALLRSRAKFSEPQPGASLRDGAG